MVEIEVVWRAMSSMKEKRARKGCLGRMESSCRRMGSMKRWKRMGDMGQPCRKPLRVMAAKREKPLMEG